MIVTFIDWNERNNGAESSLLLNIIFIDEQRMMNLISCCNYMYNAKISIKRILDFEWELPKHHRIYFILAPSPKNNHQFSLFFTPPISLQEILIPFVAIFLQQCASTLLPQPFSFNRDISFFLGGWWNYRSSFPRFEEGNVVRKL